MKGKDKKKQGKNKQEKDKIWKKVRKSMKQNKEECVVLQIVRSMIVVRKKENKNKNKREVVEK